jgi:hypothetical protein
MESSVVLVNGSKNVVGYDECLNSVLLRHYNHVNRGGVLDCELLGGSLRILGGLCLETAF